MTQPTNDFTKDLCLGYALQALIEAEVRITMLMQRFPNFGVQLDGIRAPLKLDIESLKKRWGYPPLGTE